MQGAGLGAFPLIAVEQVAAYSTNTLILIYEKWRLSACLFAHFSAHPAARRQGRPVFIRRASTARFVMPARATAPDAEHQEAERSPGAQGTPPQILRCS